MPGDSRGRRRWTRSAPWCSSTWSATASCEIPLEANSDPALYALFADAARRRSGGPAPFEGNVGGIGDDHVPFLEAGVPARRPDRLRVRPRAFPGAYWHTAEDTLDKVCPESLEAVGEAALAAIPRIR